MRVGQVALVWLPLLTGSQSDALWVNSARHYYSIVCTLALSSVGSQRGVGDDDDDQGDKARGGFGMQASAFCSHTRSSSHMQDREQILRYAAGMPGPSDRHAQIGRSVLPVQIGTIPGTQNWDGVVELWFMFGVKAAGAPTASGWHIRSFTCERSDVCSI
jgi:hypothetical protein